MFGARGALHLNVLMNTSDVPLQILSVEHIGQKGQFLRILLWTPSMCRAKRLAWNIFGQRGQCLRMLSWTSLMCLARLLKIISFPLIPDSRVDHLHVPGKVGRSYFLLALWALSCVPHVSFPNMEFLSSRADHLVTVSDYTLSWTHGRHWYAWSVSKVYGILCRIEDISWAPQSLLLHLGRQQLPHQAPQNCQPPTPQQSLQWSIPYFPQPVQQRRLIQKQFIRRHSCCWCLYWQPVPHQDLIGLN